MTDIIALGYADAHPHTKMEYLGKMMSVLLFSCREKMAKWEHWFWVTIFLLFTSRKYKIL